MIDKPKLVAASPKDTAVDIIAGFASSVPVVGPIISTAIKDLIPNVRLERIERYIQYLQERIDEIQLEASLMTPDGLDIFEEGLWQSARAVSEERKLHIAELATKALTAEESERLQARHYMRILNLLGDDEVAFLSKLACGETFTANGALIQLYEPHLNSLGLFAVVSEDLRGVKNDEDEKEGSLKEYGITDIGKEFVKFLSLPDRNIE
jgi:hypothetical protein